MDVREPSEGERRKATGLLLERWGSRRVVSRGRVHEPTGYPMLVAIHEGQVAGVLTYEVGDGQMEAVTVDGFVDGVGAVAPAEARDPRDGRRRYPDPR